VRLALVDYWPIDPLPTPPAPYPTAAWWRWYSALTLEMRRVV
jgi:hypothetical protein